jgi:hypothetical protein
MNGFKLNFEWPADGPVGDDTSHDLDADSVAKAKVKAAILYAGASFEPVPPQAYRIEGPDGGLVYRFPERRRETQ